MKSGKNQTKICYCGVVSVTQTLQLRSVHELNIKWLVDIRNKYMMYCWIPTLDELQAVSLVAMALAKLPVYLLGTSLEHPINLQATCNC